jgi:hypothetical protein
MYWADIRFHCFVLAIKEDKRGIELPKKANTIGREVDIVRMKQCI